MATSQYKMKTGVNATQSGRALQDSFEELRDVYGRIEAHFEAMTQQKDDTTDYTTMAGVYGFVDAAGAISESVAEAAYSEINSLIGNGGAALKQCCARLKQ